MVFNNSILVFLPVVEYLFIFSLEEMMTAFFSSRLPPGAENIKKYWSRYYQGSQGVVFVLDSASSDEELESARNELHSALQHPQLCTLPFLILANHQDKPAARTPNQVEDRTICPMYTNIQWKCGS